MAIESNPSRSNKEKLLPPKDSKSKTSIFLGRLYLVPTVSQSHIRRMECTTISYQIFTLRLSEIFFMEKMADSFCKLKIENRSPKTFKPSTDPEIGKQFYIMSKVCTERVKIGPFMSFIKGVWKLNEKYQIQYRKTNKFLFSFQSEKDRDRVYDGGPWNYEGNLIVMNKVDGKTQVDSIDIHKQEFWIQLHGLPPHYLISDYADQIKNMVGDITSVDIPKNGISRYPFLRCRRWVDVDEPLDRFGDFQTSDGKNHNLNFFYEGLPKFCYKCGRLSHSIKICPERETVDRSAILSFGNWLRAENPNRKNLKKKTGGSSKWGKGKSWSEGETSKSTYRRPGYSHQGKEDDGSDLAMVPVDDGGESVHSSGSLYTKPSGEMVLTDQHITNKETRGQKVALGSDKGMTIKPVFLASNTIKGKDDPLTTVPEIMASSTLKGKEILMSSDGIQHLRPFHRLKSKVIIDSNTKTSPTLFLTEYPSGQKRVDDVSEDRNTKRSKFAPEEMECIQSTEKAREAIEPPCQE